MKKKVLLSLFAALTLLSSCSNDIENPSVAKGKDGKITFNTWSGKPLRAETTAGTMEDFAVGAWDVLGKTLIMDGITVAKSDLGAGDWDYDGDVFWPNFGTVYFYAISPAADNGVTFGALTLTDTVTTIEYTTPEVEQMKDLLVAKQTGNYTENSSAGVTLNFRHALARIKVNVTTIGLLGVKINELAFVNLATTGTLELKKIPKTLTALTYPTLSTSTASLTNAWQTIWTGTNTSEVVYAPSEPIDVVATSTVNLIGAESGLEIYVIPQTTTATNTVGVTGGVEGGVTPVPSGFHIRLKFEQDTQNYCYYIPVPALLGPTGSKSITFEMERQYNFKINILSMASIVFSAEISDYDTTSTEIEKDVPAVP